MMPVRLRRLRSHGIHVRDRATGEIADAWCDDEDWVIRFLGLQAAARRFAVPTPLLQIDDHYVPEIGGDAENLYELPQGSEQMNLDRESERRILRWYGLPDYWGGTSLWRDSPYAPELVMCGPRAQPSQDATPRGDREVHLFNTQEILHETLVCPDGAYGWVDDLLVDLDTWAVKYLIVRALPAYRRARGEDAEDADEALISPFWGTWAAQWDQLRVPFTRSTVWASPAYKPDALSPRDERALARYYGFACNW